MRRRAERAAIRTDRPPEGCRSRAPSYTARQAWDILRVAGRIKRDPEPFCRQVAEGTVRYLEGRGVRLDGAALLDVGTGSGFLPVVLADAGARAVALDVLRAPYRGNIPFVQARAERLPFEEGAFDGVLSVNVLEHVPDPWPVIAELVRVCRPNGFVYLAWTTWLSPIGGHELSPFHYLGPRVALRVYRSLHRGRPPKNVPGTTLFVVHVGGILHRLPALGVRVLDVAPRYWPGLRVLARMPGVREVAMWNCAILLQKPAVSSAGP